MTSATAARTGASASASDRVSTVRLDTERLSIVQLGPEAAGQVVAYYRGNAHHLAPWEPRRPEDFFTHDYWRASLARQLDDATAGRALRLWLVARGDDHGPVLGNVGVTSIERGPLLACRLGYSLAEVRQGEGLMYEALQAVIAHVFGAMGLHRIEAGHLPENTRSARLLRRLGFQPFGYSRDYLHIAGSWRDHVHNALTNPGPVAP